jgi:hypothetical protein
MPTPTYRLDDPGGLADIFRTQAAAHERLYISIMPRERPYSLSLGGDRGRIRLVVKSTTPRLIFQLLERLFPIDYERAGAANVIGANTAYAFAASNQSVDVAVVGERIVRLVTTTV